MNFQTCLKFAAANCFVWDDCLLCFSLAVLVVGLSFESSLLSYINWKENLLNLANLAATLDDPQMHIFLLILHVKLCGCKLLQLFVNVYSIIYLLLLI